MKYRALPKRAPAGLEGGHDEAYRVSSVCASVHVHMAKPRPEKRRPPPSEPPGTTRVFPNQLQIGDRLSEPTGEWQVVGRPSTSSGGKNVQVPVQRVDKPGVTEIRMW